LTVSSNIVVLVRRFLTSRVYFLQKILIGGC